MTESDNRIDAVIEAFLDYLDGTGDEPSLDHLDPQERARADELIANLKAGRGINPFASRPSLEQLLAGTPLEAALQQHRPTTSSSSDLLDEVRTQLTAYTPFHVDVWHDVAATGVGIDSDFVAVVGAQRLRIQIRNDVGEPSDLAALDPAAVAGPVYGAFPDTAGVIVVFPNDELSSVAIDPFDTEYCIATPTGSVEQPATHRPILPLADTVRAYLDEIAPALDTTIGSDEFSAGEVDSDLVARTAADSAVKNVVGDGRRAKTDTKRATWSALGESEADAIRDLVLDAIQGLDHSTLAERITALTDAA